MPIVEVIEVDSAGQPVNTAADTITLLLGTNPPGAVLMGTRTVVAVGGVARFSDLHLSRPAVGYTLVATATNLANDTTVAFTILPPLGTALAFRTEPNAAVAGIALAPAVEVEVRDSVGRVVPWASTRISIQLAANANGATLSGDTVVAASGGVARFTNLHISKPGDAYTLIAFGEGVPSKTSASFRVVSPPEFRAASMATGDNSTCALDRGGAAWCWGRNVEGQLGEGRVLSSPTPIPIAGGLTLSSISAAKVTGTGDGGRHGGDHDGYQTATCALTDRGVVYCWGGGPYPFNGVSSSNPEPISGAMTFTSLSTGIFHGCGVTSDGTAWCWQSFFGSWHSPRPEQVPGGLQFRMVAAGNHNCGVTTSGAAYCWGAEQGSYLGNGQQVGLGGPEPRAVVGGLTFQTVGVGYAFSCGLADTGEAWCWGYNDQGSLGDGRSAESAAPVRVAGGHRFTSIAVGAFHTCALTAEGHAWCWGSNFKGELGNGSREFSFITPVAVSGALQFTKISAGWLHTCGLTASGEAWCWGWSNDGQLGDGHWRDSRTPVQVVGGSRFISIEAGGDQTCGVTTAGVGLCWGDNYAGELGDGHPMLSPVPVRVKGGLTFKSLSAGQQMICGLTDEERTWCWGAIGSDGPRSEPWAVAGGPAFDVVSTGTALRCGLDQSRKAWCWGNWNGSGTNITPVQVSGTLTFAAIDVSTHACGVTTGGDAYCWGGYWIAPPGTDFNAPTLVPGGVKFVTISTADARDCGLTAAGQAYCWGDNHYGEFGNGMYDPEMIHTPVPAAGTLRFSSISVGGMKTCGLTLAGKAYCWSADPNHAGFSTPRAVPGGLTFTSIDVSSYGVHACGTTADGSMYCWGGNDFGQLGNGSTQNPPGPVADPYGFSDTPVRVIGGFMGASPR